MSLTGEQKEIRSKGVGASEIAALLGLNPYMKPIDVYARKLGLAEDAPSYHTERGTYLEPALREWASNKTGISFGVGSTYHGDGHLIATPDGQTGTRDSGGITNVLELKAPGPRTAHEWGDGEEAPDRYVAQLAQQQLVTRAPDGYLAALVDGDLRIYHYERDAELEAVIIEAAERFWRYHIEPRVPPMADGSTSHANYLKRNFPRSHGEMIVADSATDELCRSLEDARKERMLAEHREATIEQQVKEVIGNRDGIKTEWGTVTWRNNKTSQHVDWKALAQSIATPEQIAKFTTIKPGARVFRVSLK